MRNYYELTHYSKINEYGVRVYRVRATKDLQISRNRFVSEGALGGWIEKEWNLQSGAWVFDDAMVFGNACLKHFATAYNRAVIYEEAEVSGAKISDDAVVSGEANIFGGAKVFENAYISGHTNISGCAKIFGNAKVLGNGFVEIMGDAKIYGNAIIMGGNICIAGDAKVFKNAVVSGWSRVDGGAKISGDVRAHDICLSGNDRLN